MVEPLYGNEPSVGVRELLQNSIDAVRELDIWKKSNPTLPSKEIDPAGDILIQFEAGTNESWVMRIQDHGIGMTSDTLQNFFLRAGASFRNSATWSKDFVDDKGKPQVLRSGRFGVGAFAVFLLGNSFRLWTRHVTSVAQNGFYIEASPSSNLIEIRKVKHDSVGTTLEVDLSTDAIAKLGLKHPQRETVVGRRCAWYCLDWPKITVQIVENGIVRPTEHNNPSLKIREGKSHISWANIQPEGFDRIYWTYREKDALSCNGIKIKQPDPKPIEVLYDWPEFTLSHRPSIAVFDSASNLALTVQRYGLARRKLPFEEQLARDVGLSIIAHALVKGPKSPLTGAPASSKFDHHPLSPLNFSPEQLRRGLRREQFNYGLLRWCSNMEGFAFLDPSLINLFESDRLLLFGVFCEGRPQQWESRTLYPNNSQYSKGPAVCWDLWIDPQVRKDLTLGKAVSFLTALASTGPSPLIGNFKSSEVIYSGFDKDPKHPEVRISKFQSAHGVEFTLLSNNTKDANTSLRGIAEAFAASTSPNLKSNLGCYVAEISFEGCYSGGETVLASLWREILGSSIIPFDPELRRNLIHSVRSHAELNRHIRIWESE